MAEALHIAVDLGAGSGRVFLVGLAPGEVRLEEARRFHFPPRHSAGHLRWDIHKIFDEIKAGLRHAAEMAGELGRPVPSIGVDSWGVDYGLIDASGRLLEAPVCYRDERTQGVMERVFARVDREQIFERTGIQFLVFNTLFQLYAHNESGIPDAAKLLLIPDLINYFLTGKAATEYTNATTTQMVRARAAEWDRELLDRLEASSAIAILGPSELDRVRMYAALLGEQGALHELRGRAAEASGCYRRSLELYDAASSAGAGLTQAPSVALTEVNIP